MEPFDCVEGGEKYRAFRSRALRFLACKTDKSASMHTVQQALAVALVKTPKSVALGTGVPAARLALGGTGVLEF